MPSNDIFSESDDVIGAVARASDFLADLEVRDKPKPTKTAVLPLASLEELERPSKEKGHSDPDYPDIDSRDPLYIPRFLLRRWGPEKFQRSSYLALWRSAVDARERPDPKAGKK